MSPLGLPKVTKALPETFHYPLALGKAQESKRYHLGKLDMLDTLEFRARAFKHGKIRLSPIVGFMWWGSFEAR